MAGAKDTSAGDAAETAPGNMPETVAKLVKLLAEEKKFSSTEIAETLWLALQMEPAAEAPTQVKSPAPKKKPPAPPMPASEDREDDEPEASEETSSETRANVSTAMPQAGVLPTKALPVWLADPSMLCDPLAVMRALKPLLKQVEAGTGRRLDEAATVEGIARTQLWLPVLKPETEPWFDVILVVDGGISMHLWQRLVKDLVRIFRRYGAFRDVQVFEMVVAADAQTGERTEGQIKNQTGAANSGRDAEKTVRLKSHPQRPGHRPSELIEQRGRRIAIVLSDCAGPYWWDGTLLPMLTDWAQVMPTVVWQMLPEWMWARTALGRGKAVSLSNGSPGVANQRLQPLPLGRESLSDAERKRLPVPVVTSEPDDLNNWSLMLAGDRRELTPGFLLPQTGGRVPKGKSLEEVARERLAGAEGGDDALERALDSELETLARKRIQRFLQLSSPPARRLVMLLAAAPVITLPVMRLIRDSMMLDGEGDKKSPLPVAEVFLSGLLQRISEAEDAEGAPVKLEPDWVQYDFVPKVRKLLLEVLPPVDTLDVLNSVSAAVEQRWNAFSDRDFRAFLTNPTMAEPEGLAGLRSFASVAAEILDPLGGQYADFAEELRRGAEGTPEPAPEEPEPEEPAPEESAPEEDFEIPPLRTLAFFRAVVREAAPPIQLVMDEFTMATIELGDASDEGDEDDALALVAFEFEVARLMARKAGYEVHREAQSAYQYVERLGEVTSLEMVAIPGGTFMMGSPEGELERYGDEGPQHEVTVGAFLMGKYPITQAQWRFVADLEPVARPLEADPANFKGDERPVERVSWYEAEEFCQRLSRYTGQAYQLPTEAQWEYACRAETQSPFSFGDTISPEIANYIGTTTYNSGPDGEYRQETTPVDSFDAANAFGLCDIHGNVWEWCVDPWHDDYEGAPTDGSAWLTEDKAARRVRRGGSWYSVPGYCRSARRSYLRPDDRDGLVGFRVMCRAPRTLHLPAS